MMTIDTAHISETGGREVNQDEGGFAESGDTGAWVIADGLGGHRGGDVASALAVEAALDSFRDDSSLDSDTIEGHVRAAHSAIRNEQDQDPKRSSMRTTLVALFREGPQVRWVHVGDARLYHFRDGGIQFQTKDHSLPQTMVAAGEISPDEIRFHPDRERLLRAVGQEDGVRPEVASSATCIEEGDAFLLCTDGFWEYVTETKMEVALAQSAGAGDWINRMERTLASKAEGEHDNYSAMGLIVQTDKSSTG